MLRVDARDQRGQVVGDALQAQLAARALALGLAQRGDVEGHQVEAGDRALVVEGRLQVGLVVHVAAVAHEARSAGLPLLVVPGGTFNHFARTAGATSAEAAVTALQRGEGVRADVAELSFGDRPPITVLNAASVGVYPDFVAERERLRDRWGKWPAALVAAVRVLRTSEPVTVVVAGRRARVWTLFVGVGANDPDTAAPLQRRTLEGGVLDVRILHAGSRAGAIASLAFGPKTALVLRALRIVPHRVESFTTREVTVDVRPRHGQPPGFAHDGEVALDEPAAASAHVSAPGYRTTIRIVPGALDVYRPAIAG